jgi:hypothetical protein
MRPRIQLPVHDHLTKEECCASCNRKASQRSGGVYPLPSALQSLTDSLSQEISMATQQQDGGEVILQAFRNLGINYVFSSPGSEWSAVWEALARQQAAAKTRRTTRKRSKRQKAISVAGKRHRADIKAGRGRPAP